MASERQEKVYLFGDCELDPGLHELRKNGRIRALEPQVFEFLLYMLENRDRLVGKDELNRHIWAGRIVSDASLSTCVKRARQAIGESGRKQNYIRTVPRLGFRFVGTVEVAAATALPLPVTDKPSIAVLPFVNMSDDPWQEYFADGIAEDVTTALSRFHSLFVISRNSSFTYKGHAVDIARVARELGVRYVVEGSVRKAGNRVRITAQLIDAASGNQLWADSFDGNLDNVFDLQDRITEQIVVAVEPEIGAREHERARRKPPDSLGAWELAQRGLTFLSTDRAEANRLYREAIVLDPGFALAHARLALSLFMAVFFGDAADSVKVMAAAKAAAQRALSLDPNEPVAHTALGRLYLYDGESAMAISEMRTAIAINPNLAWGHHSLGFAYYYGAGQATQALPHINTALRLSPRGPRRWATLMNKGIALRLLGRHDEAIAHCREACQTPNKGYMPYMQLAVTLAAAGQKSEARAALEQTLQLQPKLSIGLIRSRRAGVHKSTLKNLLDGLRKAGMPE